MKRLLIISLAGLLLLGTSRGADDLAVLSKLDVKHTPREPGPDDRRIAMVVSKLLERNHYLQHPLDEQFSSLFFDKYLDALDPQHMLFLQSDVEEFEKFRTELGRLTTRLGDTQPAEIIFARFLDRFAQQVMFVTNALHTEKFTFDSDDRYLVNRKDKPRPKDLDEAKKLWWERLRFEYLQEKLNKKKHDAIVSLILRRYARQMRMLLEFDTDEVLQVYLSALAHVYDPHSEYMGKPSYENFNINMKLSLFGIGALLRSEDGYCKIVSLTPGGPAEKSKKLKPNDRIVGVAQGSEDFVDVIDMKLNKVVEMIRGPKGTEVRLQVIPADASDESVRKVVSLIRAEIPLEDSEAKAKIIELPPEDGKPAQRIGIIDLPSFYADMGNRSADHKSTTTDVRKLLRKLQEEKISGLILDLRRNGGGSLEEAIKLTGLFIPKGPVVQVKDFDGRVTVDSDTDEDVAYNGPLVVLVSRFSASASEILAAALQDYGRALLVGDISTHGKGTVQTVQEINRFLRTTNNLGALKFTIRKFYRINGSSTQLKGVTPDIVLPSFNNFGEIGEAALPRALPWDTIQSAEYEPMNLISTHLAELRKRSEARQSTDKDLVWLRGEIERHRKKVDDKTVSLNEQQRLNEKKEADARAEARKNELKRRGEPPYKTYEITLKLADQPGLPPPLSRTNTVASKEEKPAKSAEEADEDETKDEPTPAVDITLEETKRILMDLVELTARTKAVAQKP